MFCFRWYLCVVLIVLVTVLVIVLVPVREGNGTVENRPSTVRNPDSTGQDIQGRLSVGRPIRDEANRQSTVGQYFANFNPHEGRQLDQHSLERPSTSGNVAPDIQNGRNPRKRGSHDVQADRDTRRRLIDRSAASQAQTSLGFLHTLTSGRLSPNETPARKQQLTVKNIYFSGKYVTLFPLQAVHIARDAIDGSDIVQVQGITRGITIDWDIPKPYMMVFASLRVPSWFIRGQSRQTAVIYNERTVELVEPLRYIFLSPNSAKNLVHLAIFKPKMAHGIYGPRFVLAGVTHLSQENDKGLWLKDVASRFQTAGVLDPVIILGCLTMSDVGVMALRSIPNKYIWDLFFRKRKTRSVVIVLNTTGEIGNVSNSSAKEVPQDDRFYNYVLFQLTVEQTSTDGQVVAPLHQHEPRGSVYTSAAATRVIAMTDAVSDPDDPKEEAQHSRVDLSNREARRSFHTPPTDSYLTSHFSPADHRTTSGSSVPSRPHGNFNTGLFPTGRSQNDPNHAMSGDHQTTASHRTLSESAYSLAPTTSQASTSFSQEHGRSQRPVESYSELGQPQHLLESLSEHGRPQRLPESYSELGQTQRIPDSYPAHDKPQRFPEVIYATTGDELLSSLELGEFESRASIPLIQHRAISHGQHDYRGDYQRDYQEDYQRRTTGHPSYYPAGQHGPIHVPTEYELIKNFDLDEFERRASMASPTGQKRAISHGQRDYQGRTSGHPLSSPTGQHGTTPPGQLYHQERMTGSPTSTSGNPDELPPWFGQSQRDEADVVLGQLL